VDINGTPFFLMREPEELAHGSSRFRWDAGRRALVLAQDQTLNLPDLPMAEALTRWRDAKPLVRDAFGQLGRLAADGSGIHIDVGDGATPLLDGDLHPVTAPAGRFTDLTIGTVGDDGPGQTARLAAPYSDGAAAHGLLLFDLRRRWHVALALDAPLLRAVVAADATVWALSDTTLLRLLGEPLPLPYQPRPERFEPRTVNPHPLRVDWTWPLPAPWAPLALAADAAALFLLAHDGDDQAILTRPASDDPAAPWQVFTLAGAPFCIEQGLLPDGRLATLPPTPEPPAEAVPASALRHPDCPVWELSPDLAPDGDAAEAPPPARLIRERHPLRRPAGDRLIASADGRLRYPARPEPARPAPTLQPTPVLLSLPRPAYHSAARVTPRLGDHGKGLDSGAAGNLWHRLYLEGCIPPGCGIRIFAKVFDDPDTRAALPFIEQPALAWNPIGTELPGSRPLLAPVRGESGLFELLLQRRTGASRGLRGRFLQLRFLFTSDGRQTPAIHGIRVYAPRFSYQEAYLPELFRQQLDPNAPPTPDAPANGADVRERLLAAFEGVLTPIEGRIKAGEALLHPDSMPAAQIGWLAEALGMSAPDWWPEQRRRRQLREGTEIQRRRGTLAGVQLALDIVTDGGVGRGEVVVVENFRLRRTMATVLGLDMDDSDHPLTLGTGANANSIVGDSLFLSEADVPEVLALFAPEVAGLEEQAAVTAFFERYAHRVSVLLHGPARAQEAQVRDCLAAEMPARVQWRIVPTEHPFVLGLAPLLAVDTFLERRPPPRRVRLDDTYIGREGLLVNAPALSPIHLQRGPAA
jgi:phage tail-like protein